MDERGYCRIEGRIKEMIIRGGENIYPREIEAVLQGHRGVAEAAVIGVADRFWGEEVAAVIRPATQNPPTAAELTDFCRSRLAAFKVPSRWAFTDTFPLTASGKIRKDVLSEQLATTPASSAAPRRTPCQARPVSQEPPTTADRRRPGKHSSGQLQRPGAALAVPEPIRGSELVTSSPPSPRLGQLVFDLQKSESQAAYAWPTPNWWICAPVHGQSMGWPPAPIRRFAYRGAGRGPIVRRSR
jgi:AMP-binding enzyme C-terminal domain